jgi:hypothetical protein
MRGEGFESRQGQDIFLFHHRIQPGSGVHPASYPMGTRDSFLGLKGSGREADHSPPFSVEVKNAWSYTSTPPISPHDNFTFTFTSRLIPGCTFKTATSVSFQTTPIRHSYYSHLIWRKPLLLNQMLSCHLKTEKASIRNVVRVCVCVVQTTATSKENSHIMTLGQGWASVFTCTSDVAISGRW